MSLGRYWWYFNRDRKRGFRASWHYYITLNRALNLRLPPPNAEAGAELHIVTGKDYWKLGLWMLASFFHVTQKAWPIVVHDDGSCDSTVKEAIKKVAPFARFIARTEADAKVGPRLRAYPKTLELRESLPLSLKLIDTGLLAQGPKRIVLDCDMIFFRAPDELLEWTAATEAPNLFLTDVADASAIAPPRIKEQLGIDIVQNLNSGLCALSNGFLDVDRVEEALEKTSLLCAERFWTVEQTLFAILAGTTVAKLLPANYAVSLEKRAPRAAVMRHYIGKVRDRFYSEGLAKSSSTLLRVFSR
jgi:hypothetical protein